MTIYKGDGVMKVNFLISHFGECFTEDFSSNIKKYYKNGGNFVFVASDFSLNEKTDKYNKIFCEMFNASGIFFENSFIVDNRVSKEEAQKRIKESDVVWLAGGDTLKQITDIKNYDLIPAFNERNGITIGMSAGAINMAKNVVLAKDEKDGVSELTIYDGIGLVNINVEPHLNSADDFHIKEIEEAANINTIYGICDNSFIKVIDKEIEVYGEYKIYKPRGDKN